MKQLEIAGRENLIQRLEYFDPEQSRSSNANSVTPGEFHYDSYTQYVLSLIGFAVGFGSFWRFPYLVYKNGGGAFLIPYFAALIVLGIPLLYLETVAGQMHQRSAPFIFSRINKGYKMLGVTFLCTCYHLSGYYNIIMVYSIRLIFPAFEVPLPYADESPFDNSYFQDSILSASGSINDFGSVQPFLFIIYTVSILVCYLIVKKGVKTSGKVVVFTSIMPYFFFLVLVVRGIFLDGAMDGIRYLLVPDFSKLFAIEIWIDAIVQVFYQMSLAVAGILNLSSLKPKKQKHMLGVYLIPLSIVVCGMLCAFNVFMYLGHFCKMEDIDLRTLTLSGPELSFNIFPKALAILPWPNLWTLIFFVTMVFLGIDSQFGYLQTFYCYLKDESKTSTNGKISIFNRDVTLDQAKIIFIGFVMIFAPFVTSSAGIYYLEFFDRFVATVPISVGAVINYIFFVKLIPFQQLQREAIKFSGERAPGWIRKLLEGKVVIGILLGNLLLAFVNQFFYFFKYSFKFYLFGWAITAYPYILAYFYYQRHKEDRDKRTFLQFKKERLSQL